MEKTIEIPEGYEARIEGNKVILERKENEDEKMLDIITEALATNATQEVIEKYGINAIDCVEWLEKKKGNQATTETMVLGGINNAAKQDKALSEWSKDEKIREELIEFLDELWHLGKNTNFDRWGKSDCAKWIAYLTRQKEQQPVQDEEEREYVRTLKSLIADFLRGKDEVDRGYYQKIYDWLDGRHIEQQPSTAEDIAVAYQMGLAEGRKEQKPANDRYMEGYMEGYAKGHKDAENSYNRGVSYHFDNPNIQRLDPNVVIESKTGEMHPDVVRGTLTGGESIEDKDAIEPTPKQDYSGLTDFERAIYRGFLCAGVENVPVGIIKDTAQECLAQIKPAEWSEEDLETIESIIQELEIIKGDQTDEELIADYEDKIKWMQRLKSLRPQPSRRLAISFMHYLDEHRPDGKMCLSNGECADIEDAFKKEDWAKVIRYVNKYQPRWKPSEEQMGWLESAVRLSTNKPHIHGIIISLYEQLKRL